MELESGWSMVTSSPLRMQSEVEGKKSESQGQGQSHEDGGAARGGGPEKAVKGLMGEVLRGEFERMRGQWRAGEVGRRVVDGVVAALMFGEDIVGDEDDIVEGSGSSKRNRKRRRKGRLDKAVGIAMGSFSGERGDRTRCLWQLVAFVEVVDACTCNKISPREERQSYLHLFSTLNSHAVTIASGKCKHQKALTGPSHSIQGTLHSHPRVRTRSPLQRSRRGASSFAGHHAYDVRILPLLLYRR